MNDKNEISVDQKDALLLKVDQVDIIGIDSDGNRNDIVQDASFELRRGEVLGLIGESGAGKSTLGLAAMGYVRDGCHIVGGDINFDGIDLRRISRAQRRAIGGRRIAYVAQSAAASFNPAHRLLNQCVETAVVCQGSDRADAAKTAVELYRDLRLPQPDEIGFRYPHQVSGGQLQRAMTAMAMACRPDLIIFDEPTTALDVTTQIEVLATIRDIVDKFNTAAIYITHDLAVVAQMADKIIVMRYGRQVEAAKTQRMIDAPQDDYTKTLWAVRQFRKPTAPPPPSDETPLLRVSNVTAAYRGAAPALIDVSVDIHRARTVAVVGESGSGKSTLARCITGLLPPRAGAVLRGGEALPPSYQNRPLAQLKAIQMIYQMADTAINPRQRVSDIIGRPLEFYLGLRGAEKRREVARLLEKIELAPEEFMHRLPAELSGGQKQRVCIARALAAQPALVICDEVTSALDQLVAEEILRLLQNLQDNLGLTYIFITHDLATVKAIADDVVVMQHGKVVEQGEKAAIMSPPYKDYTKLLLSSMPEMDTRWLTRVLADRAPVL